jgi:large subunit ribosomal protein L18
MKKQSKIQKKVRRHQRVRSTLSGTSECPRLNVSRSLNGIFVQLVDDSTGKTLASANTKKDYDKKVDVGDRKDKTAVAYALGKKLAEKAKTLNIKKVVFDRGGYKYHGRVKAVAEGARDGGLEF